MTAAFRYALARLRVRWTRTILSVVGIVASGAMLGAAVTVAYGLGTGFDRTAERAGLPDIAATFAPTDREKVDAIVQSLPNVAFASYRLQRSVIFIDAGGRSTDRPRAIGVEIGRRHGYAIVSGRDIERPGETVIESGLARERERVEPLEYPRQACKAPACCGRSQLRLGFRLFGHAEDGHWGTDRCAVVQPFDVVTACPDTAVGWGDRRNLRILVKGIATDEIGRIRQPGPADQRVRAVNIDPPLRPRSITLAWLRERATSEALDAFTAAARNAAMSAGAALS